MLFLSSSNFTIQTTIDTKYQLEDCANADPRRQHIERALRSADYAVKLSIVTYPPGRAAILPSVIVVTNSSAATHRDGGN